MPEPYSISDLAREFEVTPRALRFYEDKGLLSPARRGTTRLFSERDRVRLKLTLRGRRLGLSLEEISEIIDMYDKAQGDDTDQLLRLCQTIAAHRSHLLRKLEDIEGTLRAMDEVEQRCLGALRAKLQPARKRAAARAPIADVNVNLERP
jgi:DNA-binding transcriptional MerR regulator